MFILLRTHFIEELNASMDGKEVALSGWVHEIRELGKMTFLLLRDVTGIVQVIGKKGVTEASLMDQMSLPKESVVRIVGTVKANPEAKVGFEIAIKEIENLNPISAKIPFEVTGKVPVEMDVRLNYRYIDLRRQQTEAIFKIESTIMSSFREILLGKHFFEIRTPSIVAEATEGGSELFPVQYFESKAFLAQSPQLYKQLAVIGGLDRVFTITPVFRAEKSNDVYHLNEVTQMDIEMAFADHQDVISILIETVTGIIKEVKAKNAKDLEILNVNLEVPETKVVTYNEAVEAMKAKSSNIKFGDDFTREDEKMINELYGDAVVVTEYPGSIRAFYSMPNDKNPELSNSFDFIYKGMEISSGAQRIHLPELLIEAIKKKGMDPKAFDFYINAFRCGAPPHAGWSIGLERLAMKITGMDNIRECALFPRDRKRLTP